MKTFIFFFGRPFSTWPCFCICWFCSYPVLLVFKLLLLLLLLSLLTLLLQQPTYAVQLFQWLLTLPQQSLKRAYSSSFCCCCCWWWWRLTGVLQKNFCVLKFCFHFSFCCLGCHQRVQRKKNDGEYFEKLAR